MYCGGDHGVNLVGGIYGADNLSGATRYANYSSARPGVPFTIIANIVIPGGNDTAVYGSKASLASDLQDYALWQIPPTENLLCTLCCISCDCHHKLLGSCGSPIMANHVPHMATRFLKFNTPNIPEKITGIICLLYHRICSSIMPCRATAG